MKTKKPKQLDPFDYEEVNFTPVFIIEVILTILAMAVVVWAFVYAVFNGAIIISQAING